MSDVLVLGPNPAGDRQRRVTIALPDWGDNAVWTSAPEPEAGTTLTDLTTDQPADFVGFEAQSIILRGQRTAPAPLDVVSVVLANVSENATISVNIGDSDSEAIGINAYDSSGHGRDGLLTGTYTAVAGQFDGGLRLEGDGNIQTPSTSLGSQRATYMFWLVPDAVANLALMTHDIRVLSTDANGYLQLAGGVPSPATATTAPLIAHVGNRVALTVEAVTGDIVMYVEGDVALSANVGTIFTDPAAIIWGQSVAGTFDEIRFYDRVLSQAEIQAAMQNEASAPYDANLQSYYKCNAYQSGAIPFGVSPNLPAEPSPAEQRRSSYLLLPYRMTNQIVRLVITDTSMTEPIRVGRVFIGPADQPARQNYSEGYSLTLATDTKTTRTPSAQTLVDARPVVPGFEFQLEHVSRAEALLLWLRKYQWRVGQSVPLLVNLDPGADDCMEALMRYGPLKDLSSFVPAYYEGWVVKWAVEALL